MSKELAYFQDEKGNQLWVGAFVGKGGDASVQFTTVNDYTQLNERHIRELIDVLQKRIDRVEGFRATD